MAGDGVTFHVKRWKPEESCAQPLTPDPSDPSLLEPVSDRVGTGDNLLSQSRQAAKGLGGDGVIGGARDSRPTALGSVEWSGAR